eukprot:TRINITY_DN779998_c0_g1_i1.p1 TRINITY_DN779998_c0_g1~~TRINITY_DN779998_c0_g1_i1.p1  ORF type:complete len:199 (-),score=25.88 TRINITY_DN779998_c0_g1_i1:265-861(-)
MSTCPSFSAGSWNHRYSKADQQVFDWYLDIFPFVKSILPENEDSFEIFIPGCGSSSLGYKLFEEGYKNITCCDVSHVVISQNAQRWKDIDFSVLDIADPSETEELPDEFFNMVLDKALLDTLLCLESVSIEKVLGEIYRLLKPGGYYVCVSHSNTRKCECLETPDLQWNVEMVEVETEVTEPQYKYFVYKCYKPIIVE